MSKISDLSDGGSLQSTDFLVAVRSGGNVKVQADAVKVDTLSVGTTTNNETLVVGSSDSNANFVQITNGTTTAADNRGFYVGIDANEAARVLNRENTAMFFSTNNVTQMTLDASGNLLVGKTSAAGYSTAGIELRGGSDDYATITKDGGTTLYLNRLTSDGEILNLRKDGTDIGDIGIKTSRPYFAQTGGSGIAMSSINLLPTDGTGSANDNTNDIGFSAFRFKDLYLGGGVYLGGTAAANKLDDYEETTFTATLVGGTTNPGTQLTATGNIRKVGAVVHFNVGFENVSTTGYSGSIVINGLPFAHKSGSRSIVNIAIYNDGVWSGTEQIVGVISASETRVQFRRLRQGASWQAMVFDTAGSSRYFWASGTYTTAS